MAKKTNRPKAKSTPKPKPIVEPTESVVEMPIETPAPRAPRPARQTRSQAASERLEDEYSYITGDLRRVFILAALMFALLIALNLVFGLLG